MRWRASKTFPKLPLPITLRKWKSLGLAEGLDDGPRLICWDGLGCEGRTEMIKKSWSHNMYDKHENRGYARILHNSFYLQEERGLCS